MPTTKLDLYEEKALQDGGCEGGAFLDEIGTTDLAALTETQYQEYLRRVLLGFEGGMRKRIIEGIAPF